jgi:multidrug resistance efflux pump
MLPIEGSTLLRIVIFSAFVGFVLFCASYATHVWLKRNKGNRSTASWTLKAGIVLAVLGMLGAGVSWTTNRFVDRSGIVDGGGLFVVHARRDGHVAMTARQDVAAGEVIATYHPPGQEERIRGIDGRIGEARARIAALQARPAEIDPVLLQAREQLRGRLGQQLQFREEFARALREIDRARLDGAARFERERGQIGQEVAALTGALEGLRPQRAAAAARLARARVLRRQGLATVPMLEERSAAVLALDLERRRLETALSGLAARLALAGEQQDRAASALDAQHAGLARKAESTEAEIAALEAGLVAAEARVEQDRARAATRQAREIEVAGHQVATLAAERDRAVAAQQVVAPFAGRVVYRNGAPGLAADGAAVLALSAGTGFVAAIAMPDTEIAEVAAAGPVLFALEHPVLKRVFPGEFRAAETASFEAGRVVAQFDAQLPQDAIGLLGIGREPVRVRLLWQPPLLHGGPLRSSLLVLAAGLLLVLFDRLRGSLHLPVRRADAGGAGPAPLGVAAAFIERRKGKV